jgi:hypothetical protein
MTDQTWRAIIRATELLCINALAWIVNLASRTTNATCGWCSWSYASYAIAIWGVPGGATWINICAQATWIQVLSLCTNLKVNALALHYPVAAVRTLSAKSKAINFETILWHFKALSISTPLSRPAISIHDAMSRIIEIMTSNAFVTVTRNEVESLTVDISANTWAKS